MSPLPERRRECRYRIPVPLEYVCPERDLPGKGKIRDISVSGMYVEQSDHDLDLGDGVRAPLWLLCESTTVFLEGRVVRAEAGGFAVKFHGMDSRTEGDAAPSAPAGRAARASKPQGE